MTVSENVSYIISEWSNLLTDKKILINAFTAEQHWNTVFNNIFAALNIKYQLCKERHWAEWESSHNISVSKHSLFSDSKCF